MRFFRLLAALLLATAFQTLGLHLYGSFVLVIDLFLVVAVAASFDHGPVGSMLTGSACGLAQDALTGGLFGLHGFSTTLVAWATSKVRQRVLIQQPHQVALLFALAGAAHQTLLVALRFLMVPSLPLPPPSSMLLRLVSTGLVGVVLFVVARRSRERFEAWRDKRRRRLALDIN